MSTVGQIEKRTQARVVALFRERLNYDYLGNRIDRVNRNLAGIERAVRENRRRHQPGTHQA